MTVECCSLDRGVDILATNERNVPRVQRLKPEVNRRLHEVLDTGCECEGLKEGEKKVIVQCIATWNDWDKHGVDDVRRLEWGGRVAGLACCRVNKC